MQSLSPENTFVQPLIVEGTRLAIAEAPGEMEAIQGTPLVGPSGNWLFGRRDDATCNYIGGLYRRAGVDGTKVSRVNCINCRPPNNIFPTDPDAKSYIPREQADAAVAQCFRSHVLPILSGRAWSRIDVFGDKALRIVCQKEGGIMRWRGSPLPIPDLGDATICVPTLHPAALAREQSYIPAVVSDLRKSLNVPPEFYLTNPTIDQVKEFNATTFAFDIETDMSTGQITMVGLCDRPFHAISIPFRGAYLQELNRIFGAAEELVGQNCVQFDLPVLRSHGISVREDTRVWDTMLMQHLLQPDLPHGLAFLGSIFTNKPAWKHLSGEDEALYNCRDTDVTFQVWQQLRHLIVSEGVADIYLDLSVPLAKICRGMHETGFRVDPSRIGAVRDELTRETIDAETRLPEHLRSHSVPTRRRMPAPPGSVSEKTGKPIKFVFEAAEETVTPWRSTADVQAFLYDELKLPMQLQVKSQKPTSDKTALDKLARAERKKAISTQAETSERHARNAIYLEAIQKLRKLDELLTTFCKEEMLSVERMYPHFNVHGTASGRLSSSDPNLQNIPASARYIYVPSHADWRLLEVDYSSIENRLTAWFANDTERLARWSEDPSFNEHRWTASMFFGIPYDEVEKDNDRDAPYGKAKRIGHGSNYGMGPNKIAKLYDMDLGEVRRLCGIWREVNAKTVRWQEETGRLAKEQGYLVNPFGRKRWFYTDTYFTESLSFLPQSTGADLILRAMVALYFDRIGWSEERTRKLCPIVQSVPSPVRLLLQVHDSLVFELPGILADECVEIVQRVMEQPWRQLGGLSIPIDIKVGDPGASWGEVKKYAQA